MVHEDVALGDGGKDGLLSASDLFQTRVRARRPRRVEHLDVHAEIHWYRIDGAESERCAVRHRNDIRLRDAVERRDELVANVLGHGVLNLETNE